MQLGKLKYPGMLLAGISKAASPGEPLIFLGANCLHPKSGDEEDH